MMNETGFAVHLLSTTAAPRRVQLSRAEALCGPEKWKPEVKAGMYEYIIKGLADDEALVLGPRSAALIGNVRSQKILETGNI